MGKNLHLVKVEERAAHRDVGKGETLPYEEGAGQEVGVEGTKRFLDVLLCPLSVALVELHDAQAGEYPCARCWQDFIICNS